MKLEHDNRISPRHVSDHDLTMVVAERQTNWSQQEIETHLSECTECQERMLQTAAGQEWRYEMASSLIEISAQTPVPTVTDLHVPGKEINRSDLDEYELQTLRNALDHLLDPPRHPEMMGRLGRYDIESVIGCGGMGVVLRGFDQELHRPVAIKMILPRWARNGTAKQRFAREARAAAAVLHPNVIAIHGIDESKGVPWFVMPYVAGPSLQTLVEDRGPMQETEIVRVGMQIASGLVAAHSQGLVHRDIKPGNILVDNQVNRVVITDFGLARCETDESMTKTGWLAGTLNYMSPEQSRGEDCDARSDLFSLGSLLYFLATGHLPFRADSPMGVLHKIGNEPPKPVHTRNEQISLTLANVIDRLLEKKPQDRFQSASDVERLLNDCLAHMHQPASVPAPKTSYITSTNRTRRWQWIMGSSVATVIGISLAAFFIPRLWPGNLPPKPQSWDSIAVRFGLQDASLYDEGINQLGKQVAELGDLMKQNVGWPESEMLNRELHALEKLFQSGGFQWPIRSSPGN